MRKIFPALLFQILFFTGYGQERPFSQEDSVRLPTESFSYAEAIQLADFFLAADSVRTLNS